MPVDAGGGKRLPVYIPKAKRKPRRKPASTGPRSEAAGGGGYKLPKPTTDLRHPLSTPSLLAPSPQHVAQQRLARSNKRLARTLNLPTPRQAVAKDVRRAATARRQQIVSRSRQDILATLGLGPS